DDAGRAGAEPTVGRAVGDGCAGGHGDARNGHAARDDRSRTMTKGVEAGQPRRGWVGLVMLAGLLSAAVACGGGAAAGADDESATPEPAPLEVGHENTLRVEHGEVVVGPVVSGTLTPRVQATVRAELGGAILSVTAEPGQAVRKGQVLARINAPTQDEAVRSAESSLRSEEQNLEQARRELARAETLVKSGAIAE